MAHARGIQSAKAALALTAALALQQPQAQATTFAPRPFPTVVQDARYIARGTIGVSHSEMSTGSDGMKRIYTYYELQITEAVKGSFPSGTILIREMGGEKDGIAMQVAGASQFKAGEDALVFLGAPNLDASYDVRGLSTGKYSVEKGPNGQEVLTGGILALSEEIDEHGHGSGAESGAQNAPGNPRTVPLQRLREIVKEQSLNPLPQPENSQDSHSLRLQDLPQGFEAQAPKGAPEQAQGAAAPKVAPPLQSSPNQRGEVTQTTTQPATEVKPLENSEGSHWGRYFWVKILSGALIGALIAAWSRRKRGKGSDD